MKFTPPGPVAREFLRSKTPIRILEGPIESGKSSTSAMAVYAVMCTVPRDKQGLRRSRILVTRDTYPNLRGSTAETWLDWFKRETYGRFTESEPYIHTLSFRDVRSEVVFEAFADDSDETISALRSKEYTAAWINECQFTKRRLFFEIASRTGRYPKRIDIEHNFQPGEGLKQCVIADHNAPFTDDNWIRLMRGDVPLPEDMPPEDRMQYIKPANVEFFRQPPALLEEFGGDGKTLIGYRLNPAAENIQNMRDGIRSTIELERAMVEHQEAKERGEDVGEPPVSHRYIELAGGKTRDEIERDLLGRTARIRRGAPVTPSFRVNRHVTSPTAQPMEGIAIGIGADHGLTPAVVFGQKIGPRWFIFDELVETNKTTTEFAPLVKGHLLTRYPWAGGEHGVGYYAWGDPAGDWKGQQTRKTTFQIYAAHDIQMRAPAAKDNPQIRIAAIRACLDTMIDDSPKLQIHPRCKHTIAALDGGAQLTQRKIDGGTRIVEEIIKNSASHVIEALMYLLWGGGEGVQVLRPAGSAAKRTVTNVIKKRRHVITLTGRSRR